MKLFFCGACLAVLLSLGICSAADAQDLPKPSSRTVTNICGWTVRVDDRLMTPEHSHLGQRALRLLEAKLCDIEYVVGEEPLNKLRSVGIVMDLNHGRLKSMQYHPSAGWLENHEHEKDLAKCVHICEARDFARARQVNEQPWVVLHELAHAYHDQVLGFDHPGVIQAYRAFQETGRGEDALLYNGTRTRHYGLTDPKEFFAEFTEAYFGLNDFFPFNRAELKTAEPGIYELMADIWGPIGTGSSR